MFSDPATRLWFKCSDHRLIARYCTLAALAESDMRRPPSPTYEVVKTEKGDDDKAPLQKTVSIKRNPAYDQMLATMREMRAIEDQIAANPKARFGFEAKGRPSGKDNERPAATQQTAQPGQPQKPASPLGALKPSAARSNLN